MISLAKPHLIHAPRPGSWARLASIFFLLGGLSACSGKTFESTLDEMWQWDGGIEASHIVAALEKADIPENIPAAVGVTGRGLVGRALPEGKLWTYEGAVDVLPTLVGDVVIFSGDGRVTMLDVNTGARRFSADVNGRRLEGAGYDGHNAILLLVDSDGAREDQIRVFGPRGAAGPTALATARLGTPAAVNGIGLVPYSGQYIGAMDLTTGKHIGRILLRDGVHTARAREGNVYLLGTGVTPLTSDLTSSPTSNSLKLAPRELPGTPSWPIDGAAPRPARGRPIGIYAHATREEGTLKFSGGTYISTYFEIVTGFTQGTSDVRWVTHFNRAVAGAAPGPQGPIVCLENGSIFKLSWKDGSRQPFGSLESKVRGCVVTNHSASVASNHRPPLLTQIEDTISGTGPDMVAMQKVLLQELNKKSGAETTGALLSIAQNPLVSADLVGEAAAALARRTDGGDLMIAALNESAPQKPERAKESTDASPEADGKKSEPKKESLGAGKKEKTAPGTEDTWDESPEEAASKENNQATQPAPPPLDKKFNPTRRETLRAPPVGALAQALTRMKTKGAAEALAPYLMDPSLTSEQAMKVMTAVFTLGDVEQVVYIRLFFEGHKNTGGDDELFDALVLAAQFLFEHSDAEAQESLRESIAQSLTHPTLKKRLAKEAAAIKDKSSDSPDSDKKPSPSKGGKNDPASDRGTPTP